MSGQYVQADWNQASSGSADFIKNKPTLPSPLVQDTFDPNIGVSTATLNDNNDCGYTQIGTKVRFSLWMNVDITNGSTGTLTIDLPTTISSVDTFSWSVNVETGNTSVNKPTLSAGTSQISIAITNPAPGPSTSLSFMFDISYTT